MNILQLVRNHPRRVFGYLSLTTSLIFAASLFIATLADSNDFPLAILIFFVTGGVAVLAAIAFGFAVVFPPLRNSWQTLLRRLGWCALWLFTLVVLLVQFENWRGRRAWAQLIAELKAAGDDHGLSAVVPPPVPDEENLAMTPLFRTLLDYERQTNYGKVTEVRDGRKITKTRQVFSNPRDTNAHNRLNNMNVTGKESPKSDGGWRAGKFTDLVVWQAHYRADTNFPSHSDAGSPGADILFALSKYDPELALLKEAAARPKSRFPLPYEQSFGILLPHIGHMKRLTLLPQLRASAEVAEGNLSMAAEDTLLALRMVDALAGEPLLISHLVRMAQLEIVMKPVWEGLARHQWSDGQLAAFEARLKGMDFAADYRLAIRGERNICAFAGLDLMKKEPKHYEDLAFLDVDGSGWSGMRFMPAAFADQSKIVMGRMYAELLKDCSLDTRRFTSTHAAEVERQAAEIRTRPWRHPYGILAAMLMPALTGSIEKFARAQTTVDLVRVAIALERHRLKHDAYPETLEAIDPALKPAGGLPHDVISGAPLRYARTAQGRFHLYAVGWNGTDEGGSVVWKNTEKTQIDFTQGDWIWPQPAE